jgi:hypothetical protein
MTTLKETLGVIGITLFGLVCFFLMVAIAIHDADKRANDWRRKQEERRKQKP